MHCVYMSCGNIRKDLRSKASAHCWLLVAQIPIVKFELEEFQGILTSRLYHLCMGIWTASLKSASRNAIDMIDAHGYLRHVRTFLLAHLADNPEQQQIACVNTVQSPLSYCSPDQMGSATLSPLRHGTDTMHDIQQLLATSSSDVRNLRSFKRAAKARGLNGVYEPYWRDWQFADPCIFLAPDALHQWHRMFMDHPVKWARLLLGDSEIDKRISVLQRRFGFRHFKDGFTRFRQHTGREHRDIQRVFIALIAGHKSITPRIMKAFRSMMDFIYIAQYESHSSETLRYLRDALLGFHGSKIALSKAGVRDGKRRKGRFNIRKVEMLQHVSRLVEWLGSAPQFSTEQTERCHITMAKIPYEASNKKVYDSQICRFLDRNERVMLFSAYQTWLGACAEDVSYGDSEAGPPDEQPSTLFSEFLPQPIVNMFCRDAMSVPRNKTTAFVLMGPSPKATKLVDVGIKYGLADLHGQLMTFRRTSKHGQRLSRAKHPPIEIFSKLKTWTKVRMQLRSVQDEELVLPLLTVAAIPPSVDLPSGLYNFVLVRQPSDAAYMGIQGE